ncbi:MAG: CDP-diacylglycerol--glycerol-3-phosphate 3-phosphatidyltransferase [Ruminococcaceae bacterium]|nr:CDP-diacylglycerol--glycerol-3-phosphate 3-phosphatidyltransferase [Oscillospiraceae bacterium]
MNTPNKLTLLRIILVPLFMFCCMHLAGPYARLIATVIFVLAFLTDWMDGYLARKNNQVTNFGKIMDPLADKMLTTAALVCLTAEGTVSAWVTVIILTREFIVSGIRIAAAAEGNVIAASIWGKLKTLWQSVALTAALLFGGHIVIDICIWIAAALTIISGVDYVVKNAKFLSMK